MPAACLPHQLRQVGSACASMLLVYDDNDTTLPLPLLEKAYGVNHMVPFTRLKRRYTHYLQANVSNKTARATAAAGRRLADNPLDKKDTSVASSVAWQQWQENGFIKLWLWALPVQRAVYFDIDVVFIRNVDFLLSVDAALAATTCARPFFGTGLLVLEPSLERLGQLLEKARFVRLPWRGWLPFNGEAYVDVCSPQDDPYAHVRLFPNSSKPFDECRIAYGGRERRRMPTACEGSWSEQSVINSVFRGVHTDRFVALPEDVHENPWLKVGFDANRTSIFHFSGQPKPWHSPRTNCHGNNGNWSSRLEAMKVWDDRCKAVTLTWEQRHS